MARLKANHGPSEDDDHRGVRGSRDGIGIPPRLVLREAGGSREATLLLHLPLG
ncbi:hypothetical protein IG631_23337 [Alternaria alternata]|nr:hypothetical protein IG631_24199 [Alternaria alternata]KAH8621942.1 hypothetical protein IG631_23337 [Alternaria alternata]